MRRSSPRPSVLSPSRTSSASPGRPRWPGMLLAIATIATAASACRADRPSPDDEAAIRAVLDQQRDAWNRGDIDGFMTGYHRSPEIVFTSGGQIRRGWDETLAAYRRKYVDGDAMGHLEFTDLEIQPVGADGAVVLGHWALTETPRQAEGVFSLVFARTPAGWAIVHDHSSVQPPDPS